MHHLSIQYSYLYPLIHDTKSISVIHTNTTISTTTSIRHYLVAVSTSFATIHLPSLLTVLECCHHLRRSVITILHIHCSDPHPPLQPHLSPSFRLSHFALAISPTTSRTLHLRRLADLHIDTPSTTPSPTRASPSLINVKALRRVLPAIQGLPHLFVCLAH